MEKYNKRRQLFVILGLVLIIVSLGIIVTLTEVSNLNKPSAITGFAVSESEHQVCLEAEEKLCLRSQVSASSLEDCLAKAVLKCDV